MGLLTGAQIKEISATLLMLPPRWNLTTDKPVLSTSSEHGRVAPHDVVDVLLRAAQAAAELKGAPEP